MVTVELLRLFPDVAEADASHCPRQPRIPRQPAGLVVDYIGVAQNLKNALGQYAGHGGEQVGIDEAEAVRVLMEKYEIVRAMFRPDTQGGFDYRPFLAGTATPQMRLAIMAGAIDWVLTSNKPRPPRRHPRKTRSAPIDAMRCRGGALEGVPRWLRRATRPHHREEVGFFQVIRAAWSRACRATAKRSTADRELAIQQIVSRAVVSTEIVDIMKAAGLESPDISILSDEFLAEVRESTKKNLAIEALKKLINGEVRSQSKT